MSNVRNVSGQDSYDTRGIILANSAEIDFLDPVVINATGFLERAAAGQKIQGWFMGARVVAAADNETVAQVKGYFQESSDEQMITLEADQACTQTDVGAYADIAVAAGSVTVNLPAGVSGQLEVVDFDPERTGATTIVVCKVAEPQYLAFAQV